nr:MAG TPA: Major head protein [Caudoviricetes sp.]
MADDSATTDQPKTAPEGGAIELEQLKAELEKWKSMSRKNEARAKENAEKAGLYDEASEKNKSELQKAIERAEKAEARAAQAEKANVKARVAAQKGIAPDLLPDGDEDALVQIADRLIAWRDAAKPKGTPAAAAGERGEKVGDVKQLTRDDLKNMSPREIMEAQKKGQLAGLMKSGR